MIDFEEERQRKERGVTVKDLLNSALVNADDTESIVIVSKLKDGSVYTGFSWESSLESLGMLDIGKIQIIDEMTQQ
jgi:hypothetical protein